MPHSRKPSGDDMWITNDESEPALPSASSHVAAGYNQQHPAFLALKGLRNLVTKCDEMKRVPKWWTQVLPDMWATAGAPAGLSSALADLKAQNAQVMDAITQLAPATSAPPRSLSLSLSRDAPLLSLPPADIKATIGTALQSSKVPALNSLAIHLVRLNHGKMFMHVTSDDHMALLSCFAEEWLSALDRGAKLASRKVVLQVDLVSTRFDPGSASALDALHLSNPTTIVSRDQLESVHWLHQSKAGKASHSSLALTVKDFDTARKIVVYDGLCVLALRDARIVVKGSDDLQVKADADMDTESPNAPPIPADAGLLADGMTVADAMGSMHGKLHDLIVLASQINSAVLQKSNMSELAKSMQMCAPQGPGAKLFDSLAWPEPTLFDEMAANLQRIKGLVVAHPAPTTTAAAVPTAAAPSGGKYAAQAANPNSYAGCAAKQAASASAAPRVSAPPKPAAPPTNPRARHHPARLILSVHATPEVTAHIRSDAKRLRDDVNKSLSGLKTKSSGNIVVYAADGFTSEDLLPHADKIVGAIVPSSTDFIKASRDEPWHQVLVNGVLTHVHGVDSLPSDKELLDEIVNYNLHKYEWACMPRWLNALQMCRCALAALSRCAICAEAHLTSSHRCTQCLAVDACKHIQPCCPHCGRAPGEFEVS
ncbi:hypothetical protein EXIGLDRAFT_762274 [Exidia glandulosa HHB12029]|uniref:Uncharacterized protein n=1 Tax=Exidia glandulosa HHB12029 TaxID=1314781 RepID=A0A165MV88_EXIGL|nr:hypothetical protein EXIGLDRAFT_762274 [Exidia glandulosa HHB12029]